MVEGGEATAAAAAAEMVQLMTTPLLEFARFGWSKARLLE